MLCQATSSHAPIREATDIASRRVSTRKSTLLITFREVQGRPMTFASSPSPLGEAILASDAREGHAYPGPTRPRSSPPRPWCRLSSKGRNRKPRGATRAHKEDQRERFGTALGGAHALAALEPPQGPRRARAPAPARAAAAGEPADARRGWSGASVSCRRRPALRHQVRKTLPAAAEVVEAENVSAPELPPEDNASPATGSSRRTPVRTGWRFRCPPLRYVCGYATHRDYPTEVSASASGVTGI